MTFKFLFAVLLHLATFSMGLNVGDYSAPSKGHFRTPCPALNVMSNHGFLPRSGEVAIQKSTLVKVLNQNFKVSELALWLFLEQLPLLGIGEFGTDKISLVSVSTIGKVEHDSSLVHPEHYMDGGSYLKPSKTLLNQLYDMSGNGHDLSMIEIAKLRNFRLKQCRESKLCKYGILAHVSAYVEASLIVNVLSDENYRIPLDRLRDFLEFERLPTDFKPVRETGLLNSIGMAISLQIYSLVPFEQIKPLVKLAETYAYRLLRQFTSS